MDVLALGHHPGEECGPLAANRHVEADDPPAQPHTFRSVRHDALDQRFQMAGHVRHGRRQRNQEGLGRQGFVDAHRWIVGPASPACVLVGAAFRPRDPCARPGLQPWHDPGMAEEPRPGVERKADAIAKFQAVEADVWVATASSVGVAHLVPLSYSWDGRCLIVAVEAGSLTARNLQSTGRARLGFGPTRDVVIVDVALDHAVEAAGAPAELAEAYRASGPLGPALSRASIRIPGTPAPASPGLAGGQRTGRPDLDEGRRLVVLRRSAKPPPPRRLSRVMDPPAVSSRPTAPPVPRCARACLRFRWPRTLDSLRRPGGD